MVSSGYDVERAEQAVRHAVRPRGEVEGVLIARRATIAECQAQEPVDLDRLMCGIAELAKEIASVGVVRVDPAIAEVPHQQRATKRTEIRRREGQAPRRLEKATRDQPLQEVAVGVENAYEPFAAIREVVLIRIATGVRNIELTANGLDIERPVVVWDVRVGE
jgi:hypothetical protein